MKKHYYSQEERDFLRINICKNSYMELCKIFNEKFGLQVSKNAIEHTCKRIGIDHGYAGTKFVKGKHNQFSKALPIGSESVSAGKVYVKVADFPSQGGIRQRKNWAQKNRYIYEQTHGTLPDGYHIIALDGDRDNFSPDNLYAVPKRIAMLLCANKWFSKNPNVTLAAVKWCELFYAMKEMEQ